jgi:hypothetical protein
MKKSLLIILSLTIFACGGSDNDDPIVKNTAPTVPNLVEPANGLLCAESSLDFSWNASTDSEGDRVTYLIQIATDNSFSKDVQEKLVSDTSTNFTLLNGVQYYWRVSAKDAKNESSAYSAVREFFSEGEGISNHIPLTPELVSPAHNSTSNEATVTLEWTSSDQGNDPLTFDIYLGTNNPPTTKVGDNKSETTLSVNLNTATDYFWRVVAKDDKGGQAIGQVWSFKTN